MNVRFGENYWGSRRGGSSGEKITVTALRSQSSHDHVFSFYKRPAFFASFTIALYTLPLDSLFGLYGEPASRPKIFA